MHTRTMLKACPPNESISLWYFHVAMLFTRCTVSQHHVCIGLFRQDRSFCIVWKDMAWSVGWEPCRDCAIRRSSEMQGCGLAQEIPTKWLVLARVRRVLPVRIDLTTLCLRNTRSTTELRKRGKCDQWAFSSV